MHSLNLSPSLIQQLQHWLGQWRHGATEQALPIRGSWGGRLSHQLGSGDVLAWVRSYQPGDDARHIHWRASARQRQWQVKQFHTPVRQHFNIWLDVSPSLWFGSGTTSKLWQQLVQALGLSLWAQSEGFQVRWCLSDVALQHQWWGHDHTSDSSPWLSWPTTHSPSVWHQWLSQAPWVMPQALAAPQSSLQRALHSVGEYDVTVLMSDWLWLNEKTIPFQVAGSVYLVDVQDAVEHQLMQWVQTADPVLPALPPGLPVHWWSQTPQSSDMHAEGQWLSAQQKQQLRDWQHIKQSYWQRMTATSVSILTTSTTWQKNLSQQLHQLQQGMP